MAKGEEHSDSRVEAARYLVDRLVDEERRQAGERAGARAGAQAGEQPREAEPSNAGAPTMDQRAHVVENAIQQAIRRGEFDNLPGAGKPLENLTGTHDPDWWIRRKIERERLTGLGPPALTLRTENEQLEAKLDATGSEARVREILHDFNKRVVEARRQLQGGPPVVTATRDVDADVARWRDRRDARIQAAQAERERREAEDVTLTWRERRARRAAERRGETRD
ncbi:hypothetical protein GCM10027406_00060 [Leifsonia lichenia]